MKKLSAVIVTLLSITAGKCYGIQRFPKPEFETGYVQPDTLTPFPRSEFLAYLDIIVLVITLSIISWLILKKRSRLMVFLSSLFSLAYFGFYREGCVCSIGAIQNVALAAFDHSYVIPLTALAFFLVPLVYTVLFGRTFCAGICPFGVLQDLVAFKPQPMGIRLNTILGILPYLYLGFAILYAATGTDFIICRYDPFVGVFRLNASFGMLLFAAILLASGIFIARPYCRFLCPYGVLLNWLSRASWRHMTITPSQCIQCRLCEGACPYDAIDVPLVARNPEPRKIRVRKLILLTLLIPFLVITGAWIGMKLYPVFASVNPNVKLANQVLFPAINKNTNESFEIQAYKSSGKPQEEVVRDASEVYKSFRNGSMALGGFLGLLFGIKIAGKMIHRHNPDYIPHKGRCFSCLRCVDYCPVKS